MFRLSELQAALNESLKRGDVITDEASAMERAGFPVRVVPGPACNLKITIPEDLNLAEFYLQALSRTDLILCELDTVLTSTRLVKETTWFLVE